MSERKQHQINSCILTCSLTIPNLPTVAKMVSAITLGETAVFPEHKVRIW